MPLPAVSLRENLSELPAFRLWVESRTLHFKKPATTSRGALTDRLVYYIHAEATGGESAQRGVSPAPPAPGGAMRRDCGRPHGVGECCFMPGLSKDETPDAENKLHAVCREVTSLQTLPGTYMADSPAIRFGLESALLSMKAASPVIWDTAFTRSEASIPLHHLVWMGNLAAMRDGLLSGGSEGAACLKCKVGALPFADELRLLREVHERFPLAELRVDANGAFAPQEAAAKLEALAAAGVSCIEQPIRPGQPEALASLIRHSPIAIALDEELIAPSTREERQRLLDTLTRAQAVRPLALVLKPSLHGGLLAAEEWVSLAEERHLRWWCNSALESHVGHSVLAQWCALRAPGVLQGLGTGQLFADDSSPNILLKNHHLYWQSR